MQSRHLVAGTFAMGQAKKTRESRHLSTGSCEEN
jgi:hypothetical protein